MKIKIDYFILRLLRDNLIYLIGLGVVLIGFTISLFFFISRRTDTTKKIAQADSDIVALKKKVNIISYRNDIISQGIDLDQMNKFLSLLIPDSEDYFSIIVALERLSLQTHFIIVTYAINLKDSTSSKLSLTIDGQGDPDAFLNFLKEYNFSGARLITIDKISYSSQEQKGIELLANFYTAKTGSLEDVKPLSEEDKELIKTINSKISVVFSSPEEASTLQYSVKTNPF